MAAQRTEHCGRQVEPVRVGTGLGLDMGSRSRPGGAGVGRALGKAEKARSGPGESGGEVQREGREAGHGGEGDVGL